MLRFLACCLVVLCCGQVRADCNLPEQGDGRVMTATDARSLRLDDGREIRLVGLQVPMETIDVTNALAPLQGRRVLLFGKDDQPDRYGRQPAVVVVEDSRRMVQVELLENGAAYYDGTLEEAGCAGELKKAEAIARIARKGVWAEPGAIKNAERADDIGALTGQFAVVEGKPVSVREAGGTFYVNFGRRWTEGFAVIISRRMLARLEAVGFGPKSLEGRRLRIRGFVERRAGPRIEILRVGQIELAE